MKILKKYPFLVYLLCFSVIILPVFHVLFRFPDIKSDKAEEHNNQLTCISLLAFLPLLGVIIYTILPKTSLK
jgi:hypothetical protein